MTKRSKKTTSLVCVRLTAEECEQLDRIRKSNQIGDLNRSEKLRHLILTEYARRFNGPKVQPETYSSEFRAGRPKPSDTFPPNKPTKKD